MAEARPHPRFARPLPEGEVMASRRRNPEGEVLAQRRAHAGGLLHAAR